MGLVGTLKRHDRRQGHFQRLGSWQPNHPASHARTLSPSYAGDNRKALILGRHCKELGRPANAVLRTALLTTLLSESSAAAQAKLALIPPQRLAFFERLVVAGTPEDDIPRVRTLLEVGSQYVMCFMPAADWESLELLARRVLPSVAGLMTPVASHALGATSHANV